MRKLFFVVLVLLSCCIFLSAARKKGTKVPEGLKKAFESSGEWCFFHFPKNSVNRLTYINKNRYKICKEGDLFKKILYKNKYYARDSEKNIYKPYWRMKKDFGPHLVPAPQYIKSLNNKEKLLAKTIQESKEKLSKEQAAFETDQRRYNHYLSYKKYKVGHGNYSSMIKSKLNIIKNL